MFGKIGIVPKKSSISESENDKSMTERKAWNSLTPELLDCSRAHCYYVIANNFANAVEASRSSKDPEQQKLFPTLDMLARLFMLHTLQQWLDWFVVMGYMDKRQMFMLKDSVLALCEEVRNIALPAVDAFGLSDRILRSPLGRRDGNVYQSYFQRVLQKPGVEDPPSYLESQLRPLLTSNL